MTILELPPNYEPGYLWIPPNVTLGDDSAADLMAECGMPLKPWQKHALRVMTARYPSGKWAGREVGLVVPRQNGKSVLLAALALHGLVITDEKLQLWSAHQFRTAQESFRLITELFDASASLRRRMKAIRASHGEEKVEMKSGARLQFIARIRTSGRGFSADRMLLDEAMELGVEQVSSLLPTMAARENPQAIYAASAGMVSTDHLRTVRDRGRKGGHRTLVWLEYCARPSADGRGNYAVVQDGRTVNYDLDSRDEWRRANPSINDLIGMDHIETERSALPDEDFARERLGIWTDPPGEEAVERPFTPKDWDDCMHAKLPRANSVRVLGVDVGPNGEWASISGAIATPEGVFVSLAASKAGTRWIGRAIADIESRHVIEKVVIDGIGASGSIIEDLRLDIETPIKVMTTKDVINGCAEFQQGVLARTLWHSGDEQLSAAVVAARKRAVGDTGWAWRRSDSMADITPLVAATLAHHVALEYVRRDETSGPEHQGREFG